MNSLLLTLVITMIALQCSAFAPSSSNISSSPRHQNEIGISGMGSTTKLQFFNQGPKDDGSPGDYVCKDCGYVFTKGPQAWAALDDKYKCPPCGAPKFRFKKVPKGSASGKVEVKKNWFGK